MMIIKLDNSSAWLLQIAREIRFERPFLVSLIPLFLNVFQD